MELSFEVPTKSLKELGPLNDFEFCLAHLALTDEKYRNYFSKSKQFTVCDNSAFELGKPMEHPDIIDAARVVKAQEIVSPDSFRNGTKTIDATENFISYLHQTNKKKEFKVMGVIQGNNAPDWANCLKYMNDHPEVDTIGVCYVSCHIFDQDATNARLAAIRYLVNMGKVTKPIHLLGMGGNPIELKLHGNVPNLRSCDTSLPIVQGLSLDKFDPTAGLAGKKLARPHDFFNVNVAKEQLDCIIHNVNLMKEWATALSNV